jgi:iron complex outermembrane recepter protein
MTRTRASSIGFLFAWILPLIAGLTFAGTGTHARFDLPAEALDKALRDFAQQANCNISYNPELVSGLQAPAIKGDYEPAEVLSRLLKGTRLRAITLNDDTIQVLERVSTSADSPAAGNIRLAELADQPALSSTSDIAAASSPPDSPSSEDANITEIVVTGTHITGVDNKTAPLLSFDRADIERSGFATTEDFLDSLPQNVKSTANSADGILIPGQGPNNLENATSVNLRGLGAGSTLTLLNGHRVAPSSYGTGVDISMIPLSAVERIEILTDGSSAVYGSDAVGGVVNIILRKDFNGEETSARVEALTRGGGEQKQIGQSLGRTWDGGGALAVLQFQDANAIHSTQRDFSENLPMPTDIYPESKKYSGALSAHQTLASELELFADVLAENDKGFRAWTSGGDTSHIELSSHTTNSVSANAGLRWQPFGDWHLETSALFSQVSTLDRTDYTPNEIGYSNGNPYIRDYSAIKEGDVKLDGTLFHFGDSSVKAAVGGSYRREEFSSMFITDGTTYATNRHVSAAYAEFYAPLITPANDLPLVRKLELSAAVRRDAYSDFGARANPRVGLYWSPIESLGVRASFSTSFRAPNPAEVISVATDNAAFVQSGFPLPNGVVGNVLFYGNEILEPEVSHNLTLGVDYQPETLHGTRFSLNYYRIRYSNRIVNAPFAQDLFINPQVYGPLVKQFPSDAAVAAFLASISPPQQLYDFSSSQTGLAGVRYVAVYGDINASQETTEGLDVGVHSIMALSGRDKLIGDLNATYIRTINTTYCAGCASTDPINTYGNPLKLRLRGALGWTDGTFSVNSAINFANAYTDTNVYPFGRIGTFTTVDLNASYRLPWKLPTTVSFAIANILDASPPHTAPAFNMLQYDPANADPRGRSVALQLRSQW